MANKTVNLPSKMLVQRLASCRVVLWALLTHGATLLDNLKAFGRGLPPAIPGFTQELMSQLAEVLAQARDRLIVADRAHRDQKALTSHYRRERDGAFQALYPHVRGMRDTFLGSYGPVVTEKLGFAASTPTLPEGLREQAAHLSDRLSDPQLELASSRFQDVDLDPANLGEEMRPLVKRLEQALDAVGREERHEETTLIAKNEALEAYNRTFLWSARTAEALFRLAEMPEIALRVRPSTRRRGLTVEVEQEGVDAESDPSTEADADADATAGEPETPAEAASDPFAAA